MSSYHFNMMPDSEGVCIQLLNTSDGSFTWMRLKEDGVIRIVDQLMKWLEQQREKRQTPQVYFDCIQNPCGCRACQSFRPNDSFKEREYVSNPCG